MQQLAARVTARIERVLQKHGRYLDAQDAGQEAHDAPDALALSEPVLSACYAAAAGGRQMFGDAAGRPALRMLTASSHKRASSSRCAQVRGINIHASAAVPGTDRARVERLCRYAARPPLAQERLTQLHDGRLRLELKKPWTDGTSAFVMEPLDFIARLVAAIPPPRFHKLAKRAALAVAWSGKGALPWARSVAAQKPGRTRLRAQLRPGRGCSASRPAARARTPDTRAMQLASCPRGSNRCWLHPVNRSTP